MIQGPHTQIQGDYPGTGANDRVSVDPVNGEYYMFSTPNQILVFDRTANGDVAPKRVLGGSNTLIQGRSASAVDPIRNLLIVNSRKDDDLSTAPPLATSRRKPLLRGQKRNGYGRNVPGLSA